MNILSIGNSFSQDSQRYLHQIAESDGVSLYCANLFIGGCSLERHVNNVKSNSSNYSYEINGEPGKENISILEALKLKSWDVITLQQVSGLSGIEKSYQPYLFELYDVVYKICPNAKIYLHETWAYEINSKHGDFVNYSCNQNTMYSDIHTTVGKMSKLISAEIIPTGTVIQKIRTEIPEFNFKSTGKSLNRDGFHLSLGYGRYIAAMTWYAVITKKDVRKNKFSSSQLDEDVDETLLKKIKDVIYQKISK